MATELANESWDLVQAEVATEEEAAAARLADPTLGPPEEDDGEGGWDGMVGPWNTTAARATLVERLQPRLGWPLECFFGRGLFKTSMYIMSHTSLLYARWRAVITRM